MEVEPMRIASIVLILWLIAGAVAAGQRGYYTGSVKNCNQVATIAVTVVAGPLNYLGMNPKIACQTPQPSK
jgi:membrane protein YdbS with pleckstrin-like domain